MIYIKAQKNNKPLFYRRHVLDCFCPLGGSNLLRLQEVSWLRNSPVTHCRYFLDVTHLLLFDLKLPSGCKVAELITFTSMIHV